MNSDDDYECGTLCERNPRTLPLLGYSVVIGLAAGVVTTLYRYVLTYLEEYSGKAYGYISDHVIFVIPAFVLLALAGYGIGVMVEKHRILSGSGIPQVKGVLTGQIKIKWFRTMVGKFIGGCASMLAGLSLGREGPSIQIGASMAQGISDRAAATDEEKRILIASGASAGLAAAFNAPLSGVIFTLEEVFKSFSPLILLTGMIAAVISDSISRLAMGSASIFDFSVTGVQISEYWIILILGVGLGLFGAVYNKVLLYSIKLFEKIKKMRYRPMIVFLIAGVFGLLFPTVICGGDAMINSINVEDTIGFLCIALVLKFLFSMASYGSGAPGGIFFPLLVMGAAFGAIFAQIAIIGFGFDPSIFNNLMVLSMAGLFTAIVRAPITGIVLLVEMTGSFSLILPLSVVAVIAYVTADLCKSEPIYNSLLRNLLKGQKEDQTGKGSEQSSH